MRFENKYTESLLTSNTDTYTMKVPEPSEWKCHLTDNFVIVPTKGNHPNWFHRWMQRLCFGFRWVKK